MIALIPTHHSRAIARIGDALAAHAPCEVRRIPPLRKDSKRDKLVPGEADGDVVVLYCNGLHDHQEALAKRCLARGQRYAVVQIALRTTRHPYTDQWRELWSGATVVWTYYPLREWIAEDGGRPIDFDFYDAPLGVDRTVFVATPAIERKFIVCTSGAARNQEGVGECDDAAVVVGGKVFHLGPRFAMRSPTLFGEGIDDWGLASMYRQCKFVSGLRRQEGFELPAAEGLLCGARPVLFDKLHYRRWFDGWGEFVLEGTHEEVAAELADLFRSGPRPVSDQERIDAAEAFDWGRISRGFWDRCLN